MPLSPPYCHQSSQKGSSMLIDSMINDDSKEASVRLEGTINGQSFVIERAVKVLQGRVVRRLFVYAQQESFSRLSCFTARPDSKAHAVV